MKKLIAFLLIVFMLLSLTSCGVVKNLLGAIPFIHIDFNGPGVYEYSDFSDEDKAIFEKYIGAVIPFIPCDVYGLEGYYYEDDYEHGINFYTEGNTKAEFDAYLEAYSDYENTKTYEDEFGYTWHRYVKGDVVVEIAYYKVFAVPYVDVYVYSSLSTDLEGGDHIASENEIITNNGKGLPEGKDGIFAIDFNKAEHVKDVTDQETYKDGCSSKGSPAVLVIPVEFSDETAKSKGYTISAIKNAFLKGGKNDYYSVFDYYYKSSYGKLSLDITVLDFWFRPDNRSGYYSRVLEDMDGISADVGDQLVLDEALDYLEDIMDLSKFDSDGNGTIDSVVLITTLDIGSADYYWAYRYWNIHTDENGELKKYDGVYAYDYMWASYQFLFERIDEEGYAYYDKPAMNTYTFIHEMAHVLGADDYYDTAYVDEPMGGCDVMDAMAGDHNPYSKFNYGWISSSRLVTTDSTVTLTLEDFSKNGDTIIIANNWDEALGVYQEYYVIAYYRNTGLNSGKGGYFERDGVVVYHVNASLYSEVIDGEVCYDVYNNNTSPSTKYGTVNNLIEFVKSEADTFTYVVGDTLPQVTDDSGEVLRYSFTVDAMTDEAVVITFAVK